MNGVSATINLLFTRSANMYAIQLISPNPTNANKNTITAIANGALKNPFSRRFKGNDLQNYGYGFNDE